MTLFFGEPGGNSPPILHLAQPRRWDTLLDGLPEASYIRLRQLLLHVEAEETGEGEEIGVVQNDDGGKLIAVHVHDVFDVHALRRAGRLADRLERVDRVRDVDAIARMRTAPRLEHLPPNAVAAFRPILARAEKTVRRDQDGNRVLVATLSNTRLRDTETLGRSGLVLVPASVLYDLKVTVITGPGLVGYGLQAIPSASFRTNQSGTATFRVSGGGQIGEMRLRLDAIALDGGDPADALTATREISVWVWPNSVSGPDVEGVPPAPPVIR